MQGVGQALVEDVVYDEHRPGADRQLHGLRHAARATCCRRSTSTLTEDPTKGNPLRVKGGGEAGITPALAVVMNAIMDALKDYGVEHMDMPATPQRIWSAICAAQNGAQRRPDTEPRAVAPGKPAGAKTPLRKSKPKRR